MQSEKAIEAALVKKVKQSGGRAYKWVSPGNAGVPDRIVVLPSKCPIFVELKADGGQLTKLQKVQIQRLRDLGQKVELVRGEKGLEDFENKYLKCELL